MEDPAMPQAEGVAHPASPMCDHVADGLAWSFYYGYLRIVLPELRDRCRKFKCWMTDNPEGRLMVAKLYILVPESGYCPGNLQEADEHVSFVELLEPQRHSRAGVVARNYQTSVYKFTADNGQEYFAPAEYAAPVMNLFEMAKDRFFGFGEQEKQQQVKNFYQLLSTILKQAFPKETECPYALIYYKDVAGASSAFATEVIRDIKQTLLNEAGKE